MEFFNKAKAVKLRSHLNKYLVADEDEITVRQSRNGASQKARWIVEFVEGNSHVIRLKSCYGKYLTPSDEPFLLGMTGKRVVQDIQATKRDTSVEWEPLKEGGLVKMRGKGGKFLRANWGTPPWRNSVTYDVPNRTATHNWVLWEVDVVDISVVLESHGSSLPSYTSPASSFSSLPDDYSGSDNRSVSIASNGSAYAASGRQGGMEFFHRAKAVRLQSHHGKYLVADEDEETVRQSRNGSSKKARWTVEYVEGKSNVIRLKSCHDLYLTATDEPFLFGMTGKRVQQFQPHTKMDPATEWEPIKEGAFHVKLRTREGKFLRANGGTPPWRNSITHDIPHRTATQDWVLWGVDVVDIALSNLENVSSTLSVSSSFNSLGHDFSGSPDEGSPVAVSSKQSSGMEFFQKAKSVRLKSHHDKYLLAEDDGETVVQDRRGTVRNAKWTVEFVPDYDNVVRLKSCYGKYLTATEDQYLLGVTGRKVLQTTPKKLDSSIEWEPVRDGFQVRLKTRYGNYLRANGGLPPWRNSITHDIPHRHKDWILWEVDVVEVKLDPPTKVTRSDSLDEDLSSSSFHLRAPTSSQPKLDDFDRGSSVKSEGRIIYYSVADDNGNADDGIEGKSFHFSGHGLEKLTEKLEEETGQENVIVCSRNPLNKKLYPLRLSLPPNNAPMHIVLVPSTSKG